MSSASAILSRGALTTSAFVAIAVLGGSSPSAGSQETAALDALAARAAALEYDIARLEDEKAIEKLQRIYGFYTDKQLWSQAADLFAANGTIEVGGRGVYVGKERVLAFLKLNGPESPQPNRLFDQMQLQPIVHVAPDGRTAKGRWHMFAQEAVHDEYARWGLGVFENEYVKERGVWKIQTLHLYTTMYTPYEDGWAKTALPNEGPSSELPPDRPPSVDYKAFPAAYVVPFHYENPATAQAKRGSSIGADVDHLAAFVSRSCCTAAKLATELDAVEHRLGLLEDLTQLERMNSIYGYYLAHLQWDDLTGIFSPTGTIEIAMRGVYAGSASVRRNLDLYGKATDSQFGLQHNHMQFQPVIDVAPDGQSAKMRSRALSIMGQWERYSQWMGGVYENDYIKENGVWKIKHDQVFNTYFVPYTVGWKTVQPRPPPGITESNPPDAPPTHPFEMYPKPFLPPFHYPNPVTGATVAWSPPQ
jgi:SnoaL-like protein